MPKGQHGLFPSLLKYRVSGTSGMSGKGGEGGSGRDEEEEEAEDEGKRVGERGGG